MLPMNIRSMVNLISDKILRDVEREARKAVVMQLPSAARTKRLFAYFPECFERWSVDVVGVKLKVMSKSSMMLQLSHMPQHVYVNPTRRMPFGGNAFAGQASTQYRQKHRKLVHKVDKPCIQWAMRGACSYDSDCRFKHEGGEQTTCLARCACSLCCAGLCCAVCHAVICCAVPSHAMLYAAHALWSYSVSYQANTISHCSSPIF